MCYSTDYILYILFKEGKVMAGVVPPRKVGLFNQEPFSLWVLQVS